MSSRTLAAVVAGLALAACQEPTQPVATAAKTPPVSLSAPSSSAPSSSGVVVRFLLTDLGSTFVFDWDSQSGLLVHYSAHDGIDGLTPAFSVENCVTGTTTTRWTMQLVLVPSGDVHFKYEDGDMYTLVYDVRNVPVDPNLGFPLPTCGLLTSNRLIAEGRASLRYRDNDGAGALGPGIDSFGLDAEGRLATPSGDIVHLRETTRQLFDGVDVTTLVHTLVLTPDPRCEPATESPCYSRLSH